VYDWCGWCMVVVGSRPSVGADMAPSGSCCCMETSLASPHAGSLGLARDILSRG